MTCEVSSKRNLCPLGDGRRFSKYIVFKQLILFCSICSLSPNLYDLKRKTVLYIFSFNFKINTNVDMESE